MDWSLCKQDTCSSLDGKQGLDDVFTQKSEIEDVLQDHDLLLHDAKNGDTSLISKTMAEEEEKLLAERMHNDEESKENVMKPATDRNTQFSKLDELLTQTQLYSEFLLEKMDDISFVRALP